MRTETQAAEVNTRIQRLHRQLTRHEVLATFANGSSYLLGYTIQTSRSALLEFAIADDTVRLEICRRAGVTDGCLSTYSKAKGWQIAGVRIHTGRTERSAIVEGEMPRLEVA